MLNFKEFGVDPTRDVWLLQFKKTSDATKKKIKRIARKNVGWGNLKPLTYDETIKTFYIDWESLDDLDDFEIHLTGKLRNWKLPPGNYTLQGQTKVKEKRVKHNWLGTHRKTAVLRNIKRICRFDWDGNNLELTQGKGKMKYAIFRLFRDD